jgi:hypothetical protein
MRMVIPAAVFLGAPVSGSQRALNGGREAGRAIGSADHSHGVGGCEEDRARSGKRVRERAFVAVVLATATPFFRRILARCTEFGQGGCKAFWQL